MRVISVSVSRIEWWITVIVSIRIATLHVRVCACVRVCKGVCKGVRACV